MNNGKVRIYELSRELNLENKDILAICDQLRIPVKSHSSTIGEADVDRIRAAAEKYTPEPAASSKSASANVKTSSPAIASGPRPVAPKKQQQILEIRQHQTPITPSQKPSGASFAVPPRPPVETKPVESVQLVSSQMKPTAPKRPVRPEQNNPVRPVQPPTPAAEKTEPPKVEKPEKPEKPRAVAPPSPPAKPPEKPKLAEPPAKAAAATPPNRPSKQSANEATGLLKKPKPVTTPQKPGEKVASVGAEKPSKPGLSVPELQRPKPVVVLTPPKPGERRKIGKVGEESSGPEEESDNLNPTPVGELELKRPTALRPPKKNKGWEEVEVEEESPKTAKAANKSKRGGRSVTILDDDEDVLDELDLNVLPATVQVSLSIARPPKPKGRPATAAPAATVAAPAMAKNKKPGASRGDRSNQSSGFGKREEVAPKRPDKLVLTGSMTVQELAQEMAIPDTEIIKRLFMKGIAVNLTQNLDVPTITMVATEMGLAVETAQKEAEATKGTEMLEQADLEHLQHRPPVVTIMGHVDHGKTSLLDAIRETKVAAGEAGGITQHIGAYHVDVEHNGEMQQVVFLDTPGHEAFTAMRARGARVTDIAILVVAADDGVQPQTVEAISHAKAAEVPIVVAINKIDKPDAQPDRVKQELTEYNLVPEEWGGDTIMVPVSAITRENLDTLLEMILLVAEIEELSANPDRQAKGTVIEANLDKSRGPVATLLVQNGTLHVGDILVAGSTFGKVRAMIDDRGKRVDAATPSFAVEVLGLSDVPAAGDEFEVFTEAGEARALAEARAEQQRQTRLRRGVSLTTLSAQAQEGELKELNLVLKADVQGSLEAILAALQQLPQNQVQIRVLLAAPGEVTQTDVDLAAASNAVIVGFSTTLASGARQAADQAGVDVREYNIIYKLLEDIQGAMEGLLEPELVEEALGTAEVRAVFPVGRGAVAGCYVQSGKVVRNSKVRVRRGGQVIYEGNLDSLKRMKEDAKEVNAGFECGIGIDKFNDWIEGDIIESFKMVTKRRTLTPS